MEPADLQLLLTSPQTLFTSLSVLLVLWILWRKLSTRKLPPGPPKLPIIGNLHNLYGSELPHQTITELGKKYGPIMHLQLGQVCTIVMSSPEMAREVMKTHDLHFASRPQPVGGDILFYDYCNMVFVPYGDYAKQLRKICVVELLSPKRVLSFRPIREREVAKLVAEVTASAGKVVNLRKVIGSNSYRVICNIIIGKPVDAEGRYITLTKEIIESLGGFTISDMYPSLKFLQTLTGVNAKFQRIRDEADAILQNIIDEHLEERKTSPSGGEEGDILHLLLNIKEKNNQEGFSLTMDNIKAFMQDLIIGGIETSATITEWAMAELIKHPAMLERTTKEVREVFGNQGKVDEAGLKQCEYLQLVVKETLRLHPSSPLLLPRVSKEKVEINGYEIPANARIFVNAWAIVRNPKYWKNAESFSPERFLENENDADYNGTRFEYVPFGAGRRMCPGVAMGVLNVELAVATLLYHFDWTLPEGQRNEDLSLAESHGIAVCRKEPLQAIPFPRKP